MNLVPTAAEPLSDEAQLLLGDEGIAVPARLDPELFSQALRMFAEGERLDMRGLASRLSIGRSTLYRYVGDRERLLGDLCWYMARRLAVRALDEVSSDFAGGARVAHFVMRYLHLVVQQPGFRRFVAAEPEMALRVLTAKTSPVHAGQVQAMTRWLARLAEEGRLGAARPSTVAYVIVRIAEGFMYADMLADVELDLEEVEDIVNKLLGI